MLTSMAAVVVVPLEEHASVIANGGKLATVTVWPARAATSPVWMTSEDDTNAIGSRPPRAVAFLASPSASAITGQAIVNAGGEVMT